MEDQEESSTPFWVKPSAHHRSIGSGALLFVLCICISIFTLFVLPRIVSVTPHIVTPKKDFVKKSWDSLNITLVLLALIFTFLSRNINHDHGNKSTASTPRGWYESSNRTPTVGSMAEEDSMAFKSLTPRGWYEGSDQTATVGLRRSYGSYTDLREISEDKVDRWRFYDDMSLGTRAPPVQSFVNTGTVSKVVEEEDVSGINGIVPEVGKSNGRYESLDRTGMGDMRRSYGSYPDLREIAEDNGDRWRFYDDTLLETRASRVSRVSPAQSVENTGTGGKMGDSVERIIGLDKVAEADSKKFENCTISEAPSGRVIKPINDDDGSEISGSKSQRSVQGEKVDLGSNPIDESGLPEERVIKQSPAVSRRTRRTTESVMSKVKSTEEMSNWDPVENFSHRRAKSTDEIESILFETSRSERKRGAGNATRHFLDSFRKKKKKQRQRSVESFETLLASQPQISQHKGKTKKIATVPPPPPPPPYLSRAQKSTAQITPTTTRRPPLPMKIQSFVMDGGESPSHPIPPPPPLPPFKMPKWKFVVNGDYVKVGSMSISPDSPTSSESGDTPKETNEDATMFCPSPDVNSKADMFIAKFRAGLKLQKMNSMKQKQGVGLSNLGPTTRT